MYVYYKVYAIFIFYMLENGSFLSDFPSLKAPLTSGIFQQAMFDDTRGYSCRIAIELLG